MLFLSGCLPIFAVVYAANKGNYVRYSEILYSLKVIGNDTFNRLTILSSV